MPLSYGRHWEAMCVEGNENEEMLILRSILLLFLPLFLYFYFFSLSFVMPLSYGKNWNLCMRNGMKMKE